MTDSAGDSTPHPLVLPLTRLPLADSFSGGKDALVQRPADLLMFSALGSDVPKKHFW